MEALPATSRIRQIYPEDLFPNGSLNYCVLYRYAKLTPAIVTRELCSASIRPRSVLAPRPRGRHEGEFIRLNQLAFRGLKRRLTAAT